jgi:hypothetical protein
MNNALEIGLRKTRMVSHRQARNNTFWIRSAFEAKEASYPHNMKMEFSRDLNQQQAPSKRLAPTLTGPTLEHVGILRPPYRRRSTLFGVQLNPLGGVMPARSIAHRRVATCGDDVTYSAWRTLDSRFTPCRQKPETNVAPRPIASCSPP